MKLAVGRIISILLNAGGWLLAGVKTVLDLIGYSTVPEDAAVAQTRLEEFLSWLLALPWWAPWGFVLVTTVLLIWLSWPSPRRVDVAREPSPILEAFPRDRKGDANADIAVSKEAMRELRKLVNVKLKLAAHHLHNATDEVIRTLPSIQRDGGRQFMDLVAYSYGHAHNAVMARLAAVADEKAASRSKKEIVAAIRQFLDYYEEIQARLASILDAWGSSDRIDSAISHWIPHDRDCMTALQEYVSEYVKDGYLKTRSWSMGTADSRFSKLIGKRYVRTTDLS